MTVRAKEVATTPGFHPPYQALTMTATPNRARRLSETSASRIVGISASAVLRTATPYRRMGARAGGMRSRGRVTRMSPIVVLEPPEENITGVHFRKTDRENCIVRSPEPSGPTGQWQQRRQADAPHEDDLTCKFGIES